MYSPLAEARSRHDWSQSSALLAMIANVNRDPKKSKKFKPADFDPHVRKQKDPLVLKTKDLSILKRVFVDNSPVRESRIRE